MRTTESLAEPGIAPGSHSRHCSPMSGLSGSQPDGWTE